MKNQVLLAVAVRVALPVLAAIGGYAYATFPQHTAAFCSEVP